MKLKAFIILLLAISPVVVTVAESIELGQSAPDFTLPDQNGDMHTLSKLHGQWVVLYFYPKDETPGCTKEACSFRDNISGITAKNAVVIGVSVDDSSSHAQFAEKYQLPFTLLADKNGVVAKQYGSLMNLVVMKIAKRHSFIINPQGNIVKIYRDVNPATHVSEIIADLEDLQH